MAIGRRVSRIIGRGGEAKGGRKDGRKGGKPRRPLTQRGRFRFAVMAILKDEAPYMEEWLCHHMAIGVDHFFLYDNGSTDGLHGVLKPYADHGIVTTVYFPLRGLQRDANSHVVRFFGATTEWIAYVDIDEFLVPERDEDIASVMSRFPDAEQVLVSRKEFCYSGHRTPPEGLVTEAYREVSQDVPRTGTSAILAKPIIRPEGTWRVGIHNAETVHGLTVNTAGEPTSEAATVIEDASYANLQMNHYFTKSYEEFQAKRNRATTSTHAFRLPDVPFDIPAQPDHVIDRWIPRTKALMEEMRTISRSPSRYGSRLRMQGFPISDQFAQEAISVVTNEVSELEEARKKRSFKSLPMPGVRGALVGTDEHGYAPARGRFLSSPHLAQQLAWLAADVTWGIDGPGDRLAVDGGALEEGEDGWVVRFDEPSGSLAIPTGGPALRCHALLFALRTQAPVEVVAEAKEQGEWRSAATFPIPAAGGYLSLFALDKWPRTIDAVRLTFEGTPELLLYDLALLTFG
jgi:hypothetical protein